MSDLSTQLYQVLLRATPEQVWEAITSPDRTRLYFHGAPVENTAEWHTSRGPDGADWGDGPVLEFDPPRRLVHEWRSAYDPELAKEPPSRVTWEIEDTGDGSCRLTVVHDRLDDSPRTARSVSGPGWGTVLDGLKTLLETGAPSVSAP
ncbi:SRPBCC family protein [Pseudonocardia dioxanivorans]|uniref:SRPBCC family protein n=1 Tax=Pseudonocardia dioxanivorans TaxID=240495 RepID=UPI001404D541|nr:SRPBCC family protein [Pseudonocardia dioxanivorans]